MSVLKQRNPLNLWKFSGFFLFIDLTQDFLKPGREGTLHLYRFLGSGMDELQLSGVESLSDQSGQTLSGAAIHRVAHKGMADGSHVDADLVGAARLQTALDVGKAVVSAQYSPVVHDARRRDCRQHGR